MFQPGSDGDTKRIVAKYVRKRRRAILRGDVAPGFRAVQSLIVHVVPGDFLTRDHDEIKIGCVPYQALGENSRQDQWKQRYTTDGYRYTLDDGTQTAFIQLLRTGAAELGIVASSETGVDFGIVSRVFTNVLDSLRECVLRDAPTTESFVSLALHGTSGHGFVKLDKVWTDNAANLFEADPVRIGPLKIDDANHDRSLDVFQPLFNRLFQAAGFRRDPTLRELAF